MQVALQVDEEGTRNQLFQSKAAAKDSAKAKRNRNSAYDIGKNLEGAPGFPFVEFAMSRKNWRLLSLATLHDD